MARKKSGRLNKTVRVLPKTAEIIRQAGEALGMLEGAFVDHAVAEYAEKFPVLCEE